MTITHPGSTGVARISDVVRGDRIAADAGRIRQGGVMPAFLHWRSRAAMASALVGYQRKHFTFVLWTRHLIEANQKQELTPSERRDLEVATSTSKRLIAVALSDLGCRNVH